MRFAREITAAVASPLAIALIGWSRPYIYDATFFLIALLALYEFLILGRKKGFHLPIALCLIVAAFILAAFVLEQVSVEMGVFIALLLIPASYVFMKGSLEEAL